MLYLIKSENLIKIGSSENIGHRMSEYKTHNPHAELLDLAEGSLKEEKFLQSLLKDYRYKTYTEWFVDCEEVREVWNKYGHKLEPYYVEYYKPYKKKIDKKFIELFGINVLYGEPLYNLVSGKQYKNVQTWITEECLSSQDIYNLYINIKSCPIRFRNPQNIPYMFESNFTNPTLKDVYGDMYENILYIISKTKGLDWINAKLKELNRTEYTFDELTEIFYPLFENHRLKWNRKTSLSYYFPEFVKSRKTKEGKKDTYYKFNI